jgi:uncharacterized membrane protein YgdD (TMEM256/DUF423 family)
MKPRTLFAALAAFSGCALFAVGASAHHSFTAEFDRNLPVEITGTVSKVEWMNPHARFYVDVVDEKGNAVTWNFEMASPNVLMRQGWNRNSLKVGDKVTVKGARAKHAENVANASSVVLANGRRLFAGQANAGESDSADAGAGPASDGAKASSSSGAKGSSPDDVKASSSGGAAAGEN